MLKVTEFEILRNVKSDGSIRITLERQPLRIATLMDEKAFLADKLLKHLGTVFLEDRTHDWDWYQGQFRFYTRIADVADVLVVYACEETAGAVVMAAQPAGT